MKHKNEFKIGIWAIVTLVVLFLGINYLKGQKILPGQTYYLVCQKVDGLAVSSHVKLHGLKVGTVLSMKYDPEQDRVVVAINLYDSDMRIPTDSKISVQQELLGTSDILLEMGQSTTYYEDGAFIVAPTPEPGLLDKADPIITQVDQLLPKIDTLIAGINVLVNESKVHESLLEINTMTTHLNQTVNQLNALLRNDVPQVMGNIADLTANLDTVSCQLKESDLQHIIAQANTTLETANTMLQQIQSEESSLGKLLNTSELHDQLTQTVNDIDSLINDIKQNPKRYIHIKVF